jgi:hypothetical protein
VRARHLLLAISWRILTGARRNFFVAVRMQAYRELVKNHPTFRERSEVPDLSFEISMQPYRRYKVDGVILFSDILTPLPGMNVDFDILEKAGPVIREPYRSQVLGRPPPPWTRSTPYSIHRPSIHRPFVE